MSMEIEEKIKREEGRLLREISEENFRINYDQLNPNLTIEGFKR